MLAVIVVSIALLLIWAVWERKPTEMLERVDSLAIPSGWTLTDEKVTGKINFCLEKAGCPSMRRDYEFDRKYEMNELVKVFKNLPDTELEQVGPCSTSPLFSGSSIGVCSVTAVDDKYSYRISQQTNNERSLYWAILTVRKS